MLNATIGTTEVLLVDPSYICSVLNKLWKWNDTNVQLINVKSFRSYIFEVWRSIDTFDVQTKEEKKLKELTEEKSLVTSDATDQNVRLSIVQESLEETRSRSEKVDILFS